MHDTGAAWLTLCIYLECYYSVWGRIFEIMLHLLSSLILEGGETSADKPCISI